MQIKLGVIGGSGLYNIEGVKVINEIDIPTPFGMTSDLISVVDIDGVAVAFLPRHGKGHRLLPTEVPCKANIWALKSLGVTQILTISAVGSLQEDMRPGDFVICDQIIDRTRSRSNSYFGDGIVGHVPFSDPFCSRMRKELLLVLKKNQSVFHEAGTVLTMEGPLYSTRAESHVYKQWDAHIIGMTALPEAKLAREAEICFTLLAMVTDYDCWRPSEESVTADMVMEVMRSNINAIREVLPLIIKKFHKSTECECHRSAQFAIMTDKNLIPYEIKRKLKLFYNKYWQE